MAMSCPRSRSWYVLSISTAAMRRSWTGAAHRVPTSASRSSWLSAGCWEAAALATERMTGTLVPQCSSSLFR
jgi:hypothetical protein